MADTSWGGNELPGVPPGPGSENSLPLLSGPGGGFPKAVREAAHPPLSRTITPKTMKHLLHKIALALLLGAAPARAVNLVANGGFELPGFAAASSPYVAPSNAVSNWIVAGSGDVVLHHTPLVGNQVNPSFNSAQSGDYYLDLSGSGTQATIYQDVATVPSTAYRLSFYIGASAQNAPAASIRCDVTGSAALFGAALTPAAPSININWTLQSVTFIADSATTRLSFRGLSGFDDNASFVDNVSLELAPCTGNWVAGRDLIANEIPNGSANESQNPNPTVHAWSYGCRTTLASTSLTLLTPAQHANSALGSAGLDGFQASNSCQTLTNTSAVTLAPFAMLPINPGDILMHPGSGGTYNVVRWTAPVAGDFSVVASFQDLDANGGNGATGHIVVNGTAVYNQTWVNGGPAVATTIPSLSLAAGATVDFAVGANGDINSDSTRFSATINMLMPPAPAPSGFSLIPGGVFTMGDQASPAVGDADEVVHTVNVSPFYLAQREVTYEIWLGTYNWATANGYSFARTGSSKLASHPAHTMEWYDAVKWCNARSQQTGLTPCYTDGANGAVIKTGTPAGIVCDFTRNGCRLPTESEWEKAAGGGSSGQLFPNGNTLAHTVANYYSNHAYVYDTSLTSNYHPTYATTIPYTAPPGSFPPNGYGLYDMAGNVWEWCWDWYNPYPASGAVNPTGGPPSTDRVIRGGSWDFDAKFARVASRDGGFLTDANYHIGFRLARTPTLVPCPCPPEPEIVLEQPAGTALSAGVIAWGDNNMNQSIPAPGTSSGIIAIAAGGEHSLALRDNGTVVAWGRNIEGQATVPVAAQSNVVAVSAGEWHSVALKADGTVEVWGDNVFGQSNKPAGLGRVVAISAGWGHTLALTCEGTVVAWGANGDGQTTVPGNALFDVVGISAGGAHSLAVKSNGTIVAWGRNTDGQVSPTTGPLPPASGVIAVAAGIAHSAALGSNGTAYTWKNATPFITTVPTNALSNVVAIAAAHSHTLSLRKDGNTVAWGDASNGRLVAQECVSTIAAGGRHNVGLKYPVISFGSFSNGTASPAKPFNLKNIGPGVLNLPEVSIVGAHASDFVISPALPSSISLAGASPFTIVFNPSGAGLRKATLHIRSNDKNEGIINICLQGTGIASTDACLASLALSAGAYSPALVPTTPGGYTLSVPFSTTSTTVTATPQYTASVMQVRINGGAYVTLGAGVPSAALPLNVGANIINVYVTAEDGTTNKRYTITIYRSEELPPLPCPVLLRNTGVNDAGALQPVGWSDTRYELSGPGALPAAGLVVSPSSGWGGLPASSLSKWISIAPSLTGAGGVTYIYRQHFDLQQFNPGTVSITGRYAADNSGQVYINGTQITAANTVLNTGFSVWQSFSVPAMSVPLNQGGNTIEFRVFNNAGGSSLTGLRVEMTASATPLQVAWSAYQTAVYAAVTNPAARTQILAFPTGDYDQDGVSNYREIALGTSPESGSSMPQLTNWLAIVAGSSFTAPRLHLSYPVPDAPGIPVACEASSDLVNWVPAVQLSNIAQGGGTHLRTWVAPASMPAYRTFMRLVTGACAP